MNPIALFQRLRTGSDGTDQTQNASESTMKLAQTVSQLQQQTIQQTNTLSQLQHKITQLERENQKLTHFAKNSALSATASPMLMTSSVGKQQTNKISLDSIINKYSSDSSKTSKIPRVGSQMTDSALEKKITANPETATPKKEAEAQKQPSQMQENMEMLTAKSIVHLDAHDAQQAGMASAQLYQQGATDMQSMQQIAQQYPGAFLAEDGQWYYYPQESYDAQQQYQFAPQYQQFAQYADPYMQYQQSYVQEYQPAMQNQMLLTQQDPAYEQYMQQYQLMQQQMEQFNIMQSEVQQPEGQRIESEAPSAVEKSQHSPSKVKPKAQSYPKKKGIIEQKDGNGVPVFKVNVDDVKITGDRYTGAQGGRIRNGVYVERVRLD